MAKAEKELKDPIPLKLGKSLAAWVRQQASNENRSINNWIETKLKEIKEKEKK